MEGEFPSVAGEFPKAYNEISLFLLSLPKSSASVSAFLSDARHLHQHIKRKLNLVITSPPYINVFNYHQNHRIVMELLDFDLLSVAHSEFGSNRKNRGNRFLNFIEAVWYDPNAALERGSFI